MGIKEPSCLEEASGTWNNLAYMQTGDRSLGDEPWGPSHTRYSAKEEMVDHSSLNRSRGKTELKLQPRVEANEHVMCSVRKYAEAV